MSRRTRPAEFRVRDGVSVAAIWWGASILSGGTVVASLLMGAGLGLAAGSALGLTLRSTQRAVIKTATAERVAVTTAAIGGTAALLSAVDQVELAWFWFVLAVAATWITTSISTSVDPLSAPSGLLIPSNMTWLGGRPTHRAAELGKRLFDIVAASLLLVAVAPVLIVVALAIRVSDGGPVFFRQRRVGRNGVDFAMLKFRSMVVDAEKRQADLLAMSERNGPLFKITNDPRTTRVGRVIRELSIDELPQLINIIRGDMSLVGPRPALPHEAAEFDRALRRRSLVQPGLTGLWQAEARADADFGRFRDLDLRYLAAASPRLDLAILAATATDVMVSALGVPLRRLGIDLAPIDGIDLRTVVDLTDSVSATRPRGHPARR